MEEQKIQPEKKFLVPGASNVLEFTPESDLTIEQQRYLFQRLVEQLNAAPDMCRSWLAQAIMEQNGIKITLPGEKPPVIKKKDRNTTTLKTIENSFNAKYHNNKEPLL